MDIEIILKGYITSNGEFEITNTKDTETIETNLKQNFKYTEKALIKIYANDKELLSKDIIELEAEEIVTDINIYVKLEETGKVIFTIKEQDLKEYYKKYKSKYIIILVKITEE